MVHRLICLLSQQRNISFSCKPTKVPFPQTQHVISYASSKGDIESSLLFALLAVWTTHTYVMNIALHNALITLHYKRTNLWMCLCHTDHLYLLNNCYKLWWNYWRLHQYFRSAKVAALRALKSQNCALRYGDCTFKILFLSNMLLFFLTL